MQTKIQSHSHSRLVLILLAALAVCHLPLQAQTNLPLPSWLTRNYSETGRPLPPGVPRSVDTNGNVDYIPLQFTTKAYQQEAARLLMQEANQVAQQLKLPEDLPITASNSAPQVSPFGFAYAHRMIGNVTTKKYAYYVSMENKFSGVDSTHQDEECRQYLSGYTWPLSRIDTNAAYQLATQWLSAIHADVKALNRDCRVSVEVDKNYVRAPRGKFVPIYDVFWIPKNGEYPDAAEVRLFTPTKALLQLGIDEPKYNLRRPVVFTNLAELFPGVARISTNYPVKTIYMPAPPLE